jgi:excinuclease ABC subunit C
MEEELSLDPFANVPDKCGVYLMKDKENKILYIGKAINIKKRLAGYKSGREDVRLQVPFLLKKVHTIDTFITFTEKEALLLENTLIKKHKPKYNILLKDDKSYTCLAIDTSSPYPRISIERYPLKKPTNFITSKPFISTLTTKTHFEIIRRTFKLRSCSDSEFKSRTRPCLLYSINKCSAPCVKKCTQSFYDSSVKGAKIYLNGDSKQVCSYLKEEIAKASDALAYEKAGHYHKMLLSINKEEDNSVRVTHQDNIDVLGICKKGPFCVIYKLVFRNTLLVDGSHFTFSELASGTKETLCAFILQHYENSLDPPKYIYTPEILPEEEDLSLLLKIKILYPKIGEKRKLLDLAYENAKEILERESLSLEESSTLLENLKIKLKLKNYPLVIECIDTSCLNGKDAVAAVVTFCEGQAKKSLYRNFHIDSKNFNDDISAMKEVITRRYSKLKTLPDLILIDGGKAQLGILEKTLEALNIIDTDIAALTKEQSRHDKGLTKEKVILKDRSTVIFDKLDPLLFLLQNIRDEAHRKAISFHRNKKVKSSIHSILDTVEGIGPIKKRTLLKTFGSISGIKNASDEQLLSTPSISKKDVINLRNTFLN